MNAMSRKSPPDPPRHPRALPEQSEWTFELIEQAHEEIRRVAAASSASTPIPTSSKSSPPSR
jgi:stage V sporulation protein R